MNTFYLDFISPEQLSQIIKDTQKSIEQIPSIIKDTQKSIEQILQNKQQITNHSIILSSVEDFKINPITQEVLLKTYQTTQDFQESFNLPDIKKSLDSIKSLNQQKSPVSASSSHNLQKPRKNLSKTILKNQLASANYKLGRQQKVFLVKLLELSGSTTNLIEWNSTQWFSEDGSVLINGKRSNFTKRLTALVRRNLIIHKKGEKRKEYVALTHLGLLFTQQFLNQNANIYEKKTKHSKSKCKHL